ncbi:MAG: hypothetical protein K6G07_07505 [Lachnospiraceae bacterium]|nr:hypothetical protein [Lachnospiraceae bacterium]
MEPTEVKNKAEVDRKCPSCGGVMVFDPKSGGMKCPYCDYEEAIEHDDDFEAEELDLNSAKDTMVTDWGVKTKVIKCSSCGAETVYDANTISGECPYCGSKQVMEAGDVKIMAPGALIPFKVSMEEAKDKFKDWIKGKFFCPSDAKRKAHADEMNGIYVPYWTYDADTNSGYTGEYGVDRKVKDKDGNEKTVTDWHQTTGVIRHFFDDELVPASSKQNTSLLRLIEPFKTKEAVEYKSEYLAGFAAERYTVELQDGWKSAQKSIKEQIEQMAREDIMHRHTDADHTRNVMVNTRFRNVTYKYIMAPVWISSFSYQNKVYNFMVNAQTGKISGSTPVSKLKVFLTIVAVIAVIAILYMLLTK